jgi:hypothetical protein
MVCGKKTAKSKRQFAQQELPRIPLVRLRTEDFVLRDRRTLL